MDTNLELLNYLYQNAQMGIDTTKQLLGICQDEHFKQVLESQHKEYMKIFTEAEKYIQAEGKDPKEIGTLTKITTYLMINMNTLTDKSPSHIAEMMIRGSTMGITEVTKDLNSYTNAKGDYLHLARQLLSFEQNNIEELKKFLKA